MEKAWLCRQALHECSSESNVALLADIIVISVISSKPVFSIYECVCLCVGLYINISVYIYIYLGTILGNLCNYCSSLH